ncbi:Aminotransferase (PLP dependent) [Mycoplasma mycoides subsp. capri LC str. 95010]|uniref:cysteine-S-conjugate beta-lyase n=1 Tax=Mycoplasma mycoides subsp. capri LC str. 95010 TaxID=862259 RepID=F4MQT2_MYCML|nr:aminotransferase class I/II-fold pyridoxal phosphate-dependent enzyme [Mycoplasma mycoides]CBW54465.1 Aminotransferase (PLP dependent) [Mycoplasma mycoides subsp. capri LC str. 95010]
MNKFKTEFDKPFNRSKTHERRWCKDNIKQFYLLDDYDNFLNYSIADTNFKTPKIIVDTIKKIAKQQSYSYTCSIENSLDAIQTWYKQLHNINLDLDQIILGHGTISALIQAVQALTNVNDNILIQSPVYKPFYNVIQTNNRNVIDNPLVYKDHNYEIDFIDFENKIKKHNVKMFILCSPHNPSGVVWKAQDLLKIVEICNKYNVVIISDEVHGDIVLKDKFYSLLEFETKNNNFVVVSSPNKMFNLAGLKGSYLISKNKDILDKIKQQYLINGFGLSNSFYQQALISAYTNKEVLDWVREFKEYIYNNYLYLKENLLDKYKQLDYIDLKATYLVWIKFNHITVDQFKENLKHQNLIINLASDFYTNETDWFRINIACPRSELIQLVEKLKICLKLN